MKKILLLFLVLTVSTGLESRGHAKASNDYQLYLKTGDRSPKWNEFIEPGFQSFDGGNLATAYVFLNKAYNLGCRDALLLYRLGLYQETKGKYKEAADLLAEAAEKIGTQYPSHPLNRTIHEHAGRALYQANDFNRALPELQKALESAPDNFMLLMMTGQILRSEKKYEEAKAVFEKALTVKQPEDLTTDPKIKLWGELMMLSYELKDNETSLAYATKILEKNPGDPVALSYKQRIEYEKFKMREREAIEKIVK